MNPWEYYEHKPLLIESLAVVGAVGQALRFPSSRAGARAATVLGAIGWGVIGIADYLVYAFGYQIAQLTAQETESVQSTLAWLRLPLAIIAVIGMAIVLKNTDPRSTLGQQRAEPHD